jgi:hypothetical protein
MSDGIHDSPINISGGPMPEAKPPVAGSATGYADICKLIDDAPITWTGGLLMHAIKACKSARFFASDADLVSFATNVLKESSPHNERGERLPPNNP